MLPVTIFMNLIIVNRMQNRVTSCLFSFVVEFANGYKMGGWGGGGGGGGGKTNSSTKNTKSSLLVPSLYIQAQQQRLIRR